MTKNELLYGTNAVPPLECKGVDERIALLKEHKDKLIETTAYALGSSRVTKILRAISFWENMKKGDM